MGSNQPESQVMVINAVKDVAAALGELINATKSASGKPIHDPAMQDLKESARVSQSIISNVNKIKSSLSNILLDQFSFTVYLYNSTSWRINH